MLEEQEQVSRIPLRLLVVLKGSVSDDLGDMGTVVRVTDSRYYEAFTKTLQWITKGEAADFLEPRKLEVITQEGDRK